MGWFGKKSKGEVIDLSKMQSRGSLQTPKPIETQEDTVDLSSMNLGNTIENKVETKTPDPSVPNMDFLSGLAGAAPVPSAQISNTESPGPITSQLRNARHVSSSSEVNELKIKLDDSEYKIEQLEKRMRELEEKIRKFG